MSRRKVTLRLNSNVVERAKNAGMNLSYSLEVKLVEYLALLNVTPRRRFELGFTSKKIQLFQINIFENILKMLIIYS